MVAGKLARTLERFQDGCEHLSVARFGGDEFVILIKNAGARALAMQIADACAIKLKEPIEYNGLEFFSGPSIGLAVYPEDGPDVTTVLKHADTAMYQAKTGAAGSVAVYCPAMSSRLRDWLELEGRLRRAVQTDLLGLQYQPKFRLSDNRVVGVEALIRWCDADHGNISPVSIHRNRGRQRLDHRPGQLGGARGLPAIAQVVGSRHCRSRGCERVREGAPVRRPGEGCRNGNRRIRRSALAD